MPHRILSRQKPSAVQDIGQVVLTVVPSRFHSLCTGADIRRFSCHAAQLHGDSSSSTSTLDIVKTKYLANIPDGPDPYIYTSGRWLHRDAVQRDARMVRFNFSALCGKVLGLCIGSHEIQSYEKIEGGFNRVFIFHMDNGKRIVARIPFRIAGPGRLTTNSEVATMAYLRKYTEIPIPKVLEWSDCKTNAIGTEYIIMEHVQGVQLHEKWPAMESVQHRRCIRALSKIMKSMSALSFAGYGSIYFADAPIDSESKIPLGDFCIGPNCTRDYWDCIPGEPRYYQRRKHNQGPWNSLSQYLAGLLDQGFSRIPTAESAPKDEPSYRGPVEEHHRLLSINEKIIHALENSPLLQNLATPTLLHPDLHKRNIFVSEDDPTVITSIIDWQSTCIEPAFVFASDTPDLVNRNSAPESLLATAGQEISPEDPEENPEITKQQKMTQEDEWACYLAFELALSIDAPALSAARKAHQNLLRPLRYCSTSWRDGAAATRQELIELSKNWEEIGLSGVCPYQPSAEELAKHTSQYDEFEMRQGFKELLIEMHDTNSEGWIHPDDWDAAKEMHRDTYEWLLADADKSDEPGISAELIKKLWPFDIEKK